MSLRTFLGILESTSPEWFAERAGQMYAEGRTAEGELYTVLAMEKGKLAREIAAGSAVIEIEARDLAAVRLTVDPAELRWAVGQRGGFMHTARTIGEALDRASVCSLIAAVDSERRD